MKFSLKAFGWDTFDQRIFARKIIIIFTQQFQPKICNRKILYHKLINTHKRLSINNE